MTWAETLGKQADPDGRQVFRSPIATLIWWVWVLFAVGNLIDLAVQGRDHLSVIAACTLLLITGVMYATALRPRIIADDNGLTIVNPVREHRVGWPAVVGFDSTELLRVRCRWTAEDGTESDMRAFYAWAVHSSRRRQVGAEMRAQRRARGSSSARGIRFGGFDVVVATLTDRVEQVRSDGADVRARRPASSWSWPAIAAILAPALLLAIVAAF